MAYKTIRKNGRDVLIDTKTGKEVKPGQRIANELRWLGQGINDNFTYSDKVDARTGRRLTPAEVRRAEGPAKPAKPRRAPISKDVPQTPDRKRDPEFRRGPGAGAGDMNAGKTPAPRPTSSAPAPAQPARAQRPTPKPVPSPAKPAATSAGKPQKWSDFNPNRGTSQTNNPLIKKDDWMMSRMKDREANQQASAAQSVGNKFDSTRDVYTPSTKVDGSAFAEKSGSQKLKFALEQQREKEKQRQQQQLLASRKPGSRY